MFQHSFNQEILPSPYRCLLPCMGLGDTEEVPSWCLEQWFSNWSVYQNHPEGFHNTDFCLPPQVFDGVGLGCAFLIASPGSCCCFLGTIDLEGKVAKNEIITQMRAKLQTDIKERNA